MKKIALLLLPTLILSGCKPSESEIIDFGMNEVRSSIKDPSRVVFDAFYIGSDEKSGHVCGKIGGKGFADEYKYFYVHIEMEKDNSLKGDSVFFVKDKKTKENYEIICIR
ncbi:hypothetical protein KU75_22885 [Pectobacterium odoriferum]|uniref:Lipoprotein n=1 Tax=Pectobacterium odoriferum TaxID=78398 RepID=A0ABR4VJ60_9GAMM|nr:hypothetical protein [Pectobacterium odoriferum]KGA39402.1 hypothetical protein KU75_22885 [Pectobacterium odoriferum]